MRLLPAAAIGDRSAQHDELRQVFVERAQAVMHPRADRRKEAVEPMAAGVELELAPWSLSVVHIERTTARSSTQPPTCGHQSLTSMPLSPALAVADLQRIDLAT